VNQKPWTPPTAAEIAKKWDDCTSDMLDLRRNYSLNHEYFMGNQWIRWDDTNASTAILELDSTDDAESRVTVNKIKPRTLSLLARLTRVPLAFEPRPHGSDQEAQRKAALERQVLEAEAHRSDWEQIRAETVLDALLGAVSAIAVEPDWEWDTEPITLLETGEEVRLPSRPAVRPTSLSALEFGLEPGTRKAKDARWWIRCTTLTPEQAQDRYDLDTPPPPDADSAQTSVMHKALSNRRGGGLRANTKACRVLVYYERPTKRGPGCVIHVVNKQIVQQSEWPFKFRDRLNLQVFSQTPIGATWKAETILNDARQLQRGYNKAFTSINRHIGKADNARMILPMGAILDDEDELSGDVGEIIRYDPNVGGAPQWMQAPQVPRWVRELIDKYEMEMDDLFSTHAVSRGQAPGDRNSGLALSILAEKDETPLGPMATNQQRGWQAVAEMVLSTMKKLMDTVDQTRGEYGMPPMEVNDVVFNTDQTVDDVAWTAADLPDHPTVHVPLESVMPRSQAAIMEAMLRLAQSFPQMFADLSPAQLATVLRTPDTVAFATVKDAQVSLALWENTRMARGVGDAEVQVDEWHDHDKHIANHNDFRASSAYRMLAPELQDYVDLHIETHEALMAEQNQMAAAPMGMPADPNMPIEQDPNMEVAT
jgi:hypothetical protein